ncbi:MAG: aminotransferase class IV [Flavobacterium sp.]|jgi:branched-chain amino acid aminotransferase
MINYNGNLEIKNQIYANRGFLYGDAIFETLKLYQGKILFLEDHYLRLMAGMRILRMKIPHEFTMEFIENQCLITANANQISESARIRFTVFRKEGGKYLPNDNTVNFLIEASETPFDYNINFNKYEIELYKDNYISQNILSNLKTNNKIINVLASIFAQENDYQNCLLINDSKNIVEATNGNLFMYLNHSLITPPLSQGCINGVLRKQILKISKNIGIDIVEKPISPFDLQSADELFISNVIIGLQPITKYRKKEYGFKISQQIVDELNKLFLKN